MPQSFNLNNLAVFYRYRHIIDDWEMFTRSLLQPLPISIWTNPLRTTPEQLAAILVDDGIDVQPLAWYHGGFILLDNQIKPGRHWGFLAGLYHVQEQVSLLPVMLLDPQPGDRVLDLCAAPGNKTIQAAVAMANQGTVVANDINPNRMRALRQAIERFGLCNITSTTYDGANFPKAAGFFDKVLVDVPCSCEGTSRKNREVLQQTSSGLSEKLASSQRALLRKALQLCKPGGRIVYSSCTYAPEENEMVIDAILNEYGEDSLQVVPGQVEGIRSSPGLTKWKEHQFHESLQYALRIWPHQNNTGGFFTAILEKSAHSAKKNKPPASTLFQPLTTPTPPPSWSILEERFGMSPSLLEPYLFYQRNRKHIYMVAGQHEAPVKPEPNVMGLLFMHTKGKYPKLSTSAAIAFGNHATRNTIILNRRQLQAYLSRQEVFLRADQGRDCTGDGYVLIKHKGFAIGVGFFRSDKDGGEGLVESLFPKGWAFEQ